jgi:Phage integrase, N-terminal SAM-like domain
VACPSLLGQEEVLAFLHDLQQNHDYEGSTVNQAVCALRLFFRDHLGRADWTCWAQIRISGLYQAVVCRFGQPLP